MKHPAVYIMASQRNGTLYTGVTAHLHQRATEHRTGQGGAFTAQYACKLLVWYEPHETMETAILREKQIKSGSRLKKLRLIESQNPTWRDLYPDLS